MNLIKLTEKLSSHKACIQHLERLRWPEGPICHYCGNKRISGLPQENRHKCLTCNRSFSVLQGTIFQASKLSLQKWFIAIYLIVDAKKGVSSLQLSRHLNVNKDTAWYLQKRIRQAMREDIYLQGIIEIDETYLGGSRTNKKTKEVEAKGIPKTGMQHKVPILGMYEREGKIILKVLNKAWGEEIKPLVKEHVNSISCIVTDGFGGYFGLNKYFDKHIVINHGKKQYSKGRFSMSSIEGFWAMLKRAVIGVYHKISIEYLQEYLNEIAFKFNHRFSKYRFEILINRLLAPPLPDNG